MQKLYGRCITKGNLAKLKKRAILRLSTAINFPPRDPNSDALLLSENQILPPHADMFAAVIYSGKSSLGKNMTNAIVLPEELKYLKHGDIICLEKATGFTRVLYRINSSHNSLLLTERCNHYCLMCSQPPRNTNDGFLISEILDAIPLMSKKTMELGLSGGEPALTGKGLFKIIESCKLNLPETSLHILTNGRAFNRIETAKKISEIQHPDLMLGIPVYSDHPPTHNFIVQSESAFDETIRAIINLKSLKVKVEIRFVLHNYTVHRLRQFSEFIRRNLIFVDHIAFMGMETIGFAKSNIKDLWVDPAEYMDDLVFACDCLSRDGAKVSLYNSQLCLMPNALLPFYKHSISDWKKEFLTVCKKCYGKSHCCGFFASNQKYHSNYIKPYRSNNALEERFLATN